MYLSAEHDGRFVEIEDPDGQCYVSLNDEKPPDLRGQGASYV